MFQVTKVKTLHTKWCYQKPEKAAEWTAEGTCQFSPPLEMFPLAWRHMFPWFRLFEKIFSLLPLSSFIYNVREPADVSRCEAHSVFSVHHWLCIYMWSHQESLLPCNTRTGRTLSWHFQGVQERQGLCFDRLQCWPSCRSLYRQQGRERSHLSFLQHATWYTSPLMDFPLTHRRLQSVVSPGSDSWASASIAAMPQNITWGREPTALIFKGTHPWDGAFSVHKAHVINGHTAIEARTNHFKNQLEVHHGRSEIHENIRNTDELGWDVLYFRVHLQTWNSVIWAGTGQCASCQRLPCAPLRVHRSFSKSTLSVSFTFKVPGWDAPL